jgi:hypothetical protein
LEIISVRDGILLSWLPNLLLPMKYLLATSLALLVLTSCKEKKVYIHNKPVTIKVEPSSYQSMDSIDNIISDIKFTPIRTNDTNLIGNIEKISMAGDKFVLLDKLGNGSIKIISDKGEILQTITYQEKKKITDVVVDKDKLEVYLELDRKIDIFDLTGHFIQSKMLSKDLLATKMEHLDSQTYAFWAGTTLNKDGYYRMLVYDRFNDLMDGFFPISAKIGGNTGVVNMYPFYAIAPDQLNVSFPLCDTIFTLFHDGKESIDLYPKYCISFSDNPLPKNYINDPDIMYYLISAFDHKYSFFMGPFLEFGSNVIFGDIVNGIKFYGIWNKQANKMVTNATRCKLHNMDLEIPMNTIQQIGKNKALVYYYPYQLMEWAAAHKDAPNNKYFRELLALCKNLKKLDNPIMAQITIK